MAGAGLSLAPVRGAPRSDDPAVRFRPRWPHRARCVRRARPDARYVYGRRRCGLPLWPLVRGRLDRACARRDGAIDRDPPAGFSWSSPATPASTLVLPALRQRFSTPFVGVWPPIKPAETTRSRLVTLLATPGTVRPASYTSNLIATYASTCDVTLVGSQNLAAFAEADMAGAPVDDDTLRAEVSPCFVTARMAGGRMWCAFPARIIRCCCPA